MKIGYRILLLTIFLLTWIHHIYSQQNYVLGEFTISKIIDGDTFKFEELDKPARLVCIDAEEMFKGPDAEQKSKELEKNWTKKYNAEKLIEEKPAKTPSPFGYKTWQWTKQIFRYVKKVRLETDDTARTLDVYGRYLVYVIAIRNDGTEFNYNLECVRQGYSAYFTKYGVSSRFDTKFNIAMQEAMNNKLGIWSEMEYCYPDYDERISWWNERAASIQRFIQNHSKDNNYFSFANGTNYEKLKDRLNDSVTVFGCSEEILTDHEPYIVKIKYNSEIGIDIVFFPEYKNLLKETGLGDEKNYYYYIKGVLKTYNGKYEIIINDKSQVWQE